MAFGPRDTEWLPARRNVWPDIRRGNRILKRRVPTVLIAIGSIVPCSTAFAGMPSGNLWLLTELGQDRISALSFFLLGLGLSAWGVKGLWNFLQRDFPRLPRLTFGKAAALVSLWGLLFVLVLTMISGARELMTPGAWEQKGATYQLAESARKEPFSQPPDNLRERRELQLERLWVTLLRYAEKHEGQFPAQWEVNRSPGERWGLPEQMGTRYFYVPGRTRSEPDALLAFEPEVYPDGQLGLLIDGTVRVVTRDEILAARGQGADE